MASGEPFKNFRGVTHSAVLDPEKKSLNGLFTKYVIPKSLKFGHWPSKVK